DSTPVRRRRRFRGDPAPRAGSWFRPRTHLSRWWYRTAAIRRRSASRARTGPIRTRPAARPAGNLPRCAIQSYSSTPLPCREPLLCPNHALPQTIRPARFGLGLRQWRQLFRIDIFDDSPRTRHHEMRGLPLADAQCRGIATSRKNRRSPLRMVTIAGKNMNAAVIEHAFGPVARSATESAGHAGRGQLHPRSVFDQPPEHGVVVLDPGQSFRMRDDRNVSRRLQLENRLLETRWRNMVG